jgi:hypothetical protein
MKAVLFALGCGLLSGCGLAIGVLNAVLPAPEGFTANQAKGELPVEVRFWGDVHGWERTPDGGVRVGSGVLLGIRVPGLTMFRAVLQLRSTGGYRLLVRTTPMQWQRQQEAPVECIVTPERTLLRVGARTDTLELPTGGSHQWELVQSERGVRLQMECLEPWWLAVSSPMTEWILLQPLPGSSLSVEGVRLEEGVPLVWKGSQQE